MTRAEQDAGNDRQRSRRSFEWAGRHPGTGANWRLYCGDAQNVLEQLAKDYYSSVITSPPYYWQRDYRVQGQLGVERTVAAYVDAVCSVMDGVREVLSSKGTLFLNLGDTYYSGKGQPKGKDRKHNGRRFAMPRAVDISGLGLPKKTLLGMPWRVALGMIDRNWILRSTIIWRRDNAVPEANVHDRPWRTYEYVFLFAKARSYHFTRTPLTESKVEDIWTIESCSRAGREHPAVFPAELVERCLALGNSAGGPVLDPFVGSGTVLRVALAQGMDADGIDLNKAFCHSLVQSLQMPTE